MSSPAEIEIAAVPEWLAEDPVTAPAANVGTSTAVLPTISSDVEDGTNWLVDESPTTNRATSAPDDVIYAPSRAGTESNDSSPKRSWKSKKTEKTKDKKSSGKKTVKDKKSRGSSYNNDNNNDNTINVNNGGDNNSSNARVAASEKTWGQYFRESFQRDGRLLLITITLLIVMNIPFLWWILYPFVIFGTWIHEMCHGLAALMIGGNIVKLEIFPGGSGLATWSHYDMTRRAFVASAGYQGTAVVGFLLLIFRRTKRGPRTGTMVLACWMILSCILWIRNWFGFLFIFAFGLVLVGLAWKLPSFHIRNLYVVLAMMTSMNAITFIRYLYRSEHYVNGAAVETDAHTMAEVQGGSYIVWATLWLILAISLTILGILFAIPGPDEVADFACCGVCQDLGCFRPCNYPGQRCFSRLISRGESSGRQENSATTANNTTESEGP